MRLRSFLVTTLLPLLLGLTTFIYSGFGHRWWRGHAGDMLVVAFLVGLLGLHKEWSLRLRVTLIAVFCVAVELSQLAPGAADRGPIASVLWGTHFDWLDLLYYSAGVLLALGLDFSSRTS